MVEFAQIQTLIENQMGWQVSNCGGADLPEEVGTSSLSGRAN